MGVKLRSHFKEIATSLPVEVGRGVHRGTEIMAEAAAARAPVRTGELKESIEARSGNTKKFGTAYGIFAAWYYFYSEFGTENEAARPWLIPAVEATRPLLVAAVRDSLKDRK